MISKGNCPERGNVHVSSSHTRVLLCGSDGAGSGNGSDGMEGNGGNEGGPNKRGSIVVIGGVVPEMSESVSVPLPPVRGGAGRALPRAAASAPCVTRTLGAWSSKLYFELSSGVVRRVGLDNIIGTAVLIQSEQKSFPE